jgi:hypothetical protein
MRLEQNLGADRARITRKIDAFNAADSRNLVVK